MATCVTSWDTKCRILHKLPFDILSN